MFCVLLTRLPLRPRASSVLLQSFHTLRSCLTFSMAQPDAKKPCISIGTHSGTFHCDEALACYMLRLLPDYSNARIVRSRDPSVLQDCDIVVDVGGVYDPSCHRYDHHQRSFDGTMKSLTDGKKPWLTKLSSAGLVYLHFGRRVIETITGPLDSGVSEVLYDRVYTNFVEEIDGVDNGISDKGGPPRYKVCSTVSQRVSRVNPAWNDTTKNADRCFEQAMELVGGEFVGCVQALKDVWLPARTIVMKAIEKRHEVDSSGSIMCLEQGCPWKEHLFDIENELSLTNQIKFVIYKETESDKWRVQAVPTHPSGFENRVSLHQEWRGLRDEQLSEKSAIPGCVFVHASGFIGGNVTFEGALQMAIRTLKSV